MVLGEAANERLDEIHTRRLVPEQQLWICRFWAEHNPARRSSIELLRVPGLRISAVASPQSLVLSPARYECIDSRSRSAHCVCATAQIST